MDHQSPIDRSILIPIGIGVFSIFGIGLALLIVYLDKPQAVVAVDQTDTPFKYILLATETHPSASEEAFQKESISPTPVAASNEESRILPATPSHTNIPVNGSPGSTANPTVQGTFPVAADQYDDADPRIHLDGDWGAQTNVKNAYHETLHVSNTIGNDATSTIVGRQVIVGYQGAAGLGTAMISIDGEEYILDQSEGSQWVSPPLEAGEHFVVIIHVSGASINLDYINIPNSSQRAP